MLASSFATSSHFTMDYWDLHQCCAQPPMLAKKKTKPCN